MIAPQLQGMAVGIETLTALDGNPRRGSVEAVAASLEKFGQLKPIVYREQGDRLVIIAGNHTWRAAKSLGWTEIAAVDASELSDQQAAAFALADNRTGDLGTFDHDALVAFINDTQINEELLTSASFAEAEIAALLAAVPTDRYEDEFDDLIDQAAPAPNHDQAEIDPHVGDDDDPLTSFSVVMTRSQRSEVTRILRADIDGKPDKSLGDALYERLVG